MTQARELLEDEPEWAPPMCDECYHIIRFDDGPNCPVCGTAYDAYNDPDEDLDRDYGDDDQ